MTQRSRPRGQDGFIREVIWIVVILGIIAFAILDGMALFTAYQSAGDDAARAARVARAEYAESGDLQAAKLAADEYLAKAGLEMKDFKTEQTARGTMQFTVTAGATADTYAFRYLGKIPPLKNWVERTTHPVRTGSAGQD